LRAQVDECLGVIRMGIALRLVTKYRPQYGDEKASSLAAAVANAVFGAAPINAFGRDFVTSNGDLVEARLRDLKSDPEICYIVSLASHTLANIAGGTGTITGEMIRAWDKLDKLGVMLPIEKVRMPKSLEDLRHQAGEFMRQAK
jgi:hypothetical protein